MRLTVTVERRRKKEEREFDERCEVVNERQQVRQYYSSLLFFPTESDSLLLVGFPVFM